jgi:hypothetical protein
MSPAVFFHVLAFAVFVLLLVRLWELELDLKATKSERNRAYSRLDETRACVQRAIDATYDYYGPSRARDIAKEALKT